MKKKSISLKDLEFDRDDLERMIEELSGEESTEEYARYKYLVSQLEKVEKEIKKRSRKSNPKKNFDPLSIMGAAASVKGLMENPCCNPRKNPCPSHQENPGKGSRTLSPANKFLVRNFVGKFHAMMPEEDLIQEVLKHVDKPGTPSWMVKAAIRLAKKEHADNRDIYIWVLRGGKYGWTKKKQAAEREGMIEYEKHKRAGGRKNPYKGDPYRWAENMVAQTILEQMGGQGRLKAMIGARSFVSHGKRGTKEGAGLSFKWPGKGKGKPNYLKITLTPQDTYDMEFGKIWGLEYKVLKTFDGVYADMLIPIFEEQTGLYLRLNNPPVDFQVGESYKARSSGPDISFTVLKRTPHFITVDFITGGGSLARGRNRLKVNEYEGLEVVLPWGSYANAPAIFGDQKITTAGSKQGQDSTAPTKYPGRTSWLPNPGDRSKLPKGKYALYMVETLTNKAGMNYDNLVAYLGRKFSLSPEESEKYLEYVDQYRRRTSTNPGGETTEWTGGAMGARNRYSYEKWEDGHFGMLLIYKPSKESEWKWKLKFWPKFGRSERMQEFAPTKKEAFEAAKMAFSNLTMLGRPGYPPILLENPSLAEIQDAICPEQKYPPFDPTMVRQTAWESRHPETGGSEMATTRMAQNPLTAKEKKILKQASREYNQRSLDAGKMAESTQSSEIQREMSELEMYLAGRAVEAYQISERPIRVGYDRPRRKNPLTAKEKKILKKRSEDFKHLSDYDRDDGNIKGQYLHMGRSIEADDVATTPIRNNPLLQTIGLGLNPPNPKLTTASRRKLPASAFALDGRRYPIFDEDHAISAKAYAKQELDKGNLSQKDYNTVVRKANKVLRAAGVTPEEGFPSTNPGSKWKEVRMLGGKSWRYTKWDFGPGSGASGVIELHPNQNRKRGWKWNLQLRRLPGGPIEPETVSGIGSSKATAVAAAKKAYSRMTLRSKYKKGGPLLRNPSQVDVPFRNGQKVKVADARAWIKTTGDKKLLDQFEKGLKLQTIANKKPKYVEWQEIAIGSPDKLDSITAFVKYGTTPETMYKPNEGSKKGSDYYLHQWGEGSGKEKPLPLLVSTDGKVMVTPIGEDQTIDDWMRG